MAHQPRRGGRQRRRGRLLPFLADAVPIGVEGVELEVRDEERTAAQSIEHYFHNPNPNHQVPVPRTELQRDFAIIIFLQRTGRVNVEELYRYKLPQSLINQGPNVIILLNSLISTFNKMAFIRRCALENMIRHGCRKELSKMTKMLETYKRLVEDVQGEIRALGGNALKLPAVLSADPALVH